MTWASDRRLDFIAWRLHHGGSIRRLDLMTAFEISMPQASADFAAFERLYPGAMVYDKSEKRYMAQGNTRRAFATDRQGRLMFVIG
jgi:hypothetical protein